MAADKPLTREEAGERDRFIRVQAAKAGVGAILAVAYGALFGAPDAIDDIAIAALLCPAILAFAAWPESSPCTATKETPSPPTTSAFSWRLRLRCRWPWITR